LCNLLANRQTLTPSIMKKNELFDFFHPWRKTLKALLVMKIILFLTCVFTINLHAADYPEGTKMSIKIAQQAVVTGKVTDASGEPLPAATVTVKGSTTGTVTNLEGEYDIVVDDPSAVLVFSYVGYITQEIAVGDQTEINVSMAEDYLGLDEVVVVGYGTQKKSELTNAVVQTSGDAIKKTPAVSLSNSLAGRLAGLFVNQTNAEPGFDDAQIFVRGFNTYRNNSALIVIDGVANADPDGLNRLDPNDIESISVLKDASAAIYGAQSAGGVVLVTTKRGKVGKPKFTYSGSMGFMSPNSKVYSADALSYMAVLNSSREIDGTAPDFPAELIAQYESGERQSEDWWGTTLDPPMNLNRHSLTMRGGTERVRYFNSVGTTGQGSLLRGDDKTHLNQYNVRSNIDVDVSDRLTVGIDLSFRQKLTKAPQGVEYHRVATTSPLKEAYIDGDYRYPSEGWSHLNPVAKIGSPGYRRYTSNVFGGTIRLKYDIPGIKGLALDGFASLNKVDNYDKSFDYVWPYWEKNAAGEIVEKVSRSVEDIGMREDYGANTRLTLNAKLSYTKTIKEDHNIHAFVAYEQMEYNENSFWTERLGFESALIDQLFAASTDRANYNSSGTASESARRNYFGRLNYNFRNKYLLGFNFRYDGSPIFPEETRFGFFPGVSAGWLISEESFMSGNVFSHLKLRGSWGQTGNDRVDPFQYIGVYEYSDGYVIDGSDVRGIAAATTPNPNITWEVSENSNLGLEAGFLEGKLNFEVDVFKITTSNILGQRQSSIPQYTGLILPDENIGEMENKGFEFQATYRQHFGKLTFRASGNISYSKNKIIYFDEVPQAEPYQALQGMPFNSELVYKSMGIYRTQADLDNNINYANAGLGDLIFEDLNNDGVIDALDTYRYDASSFPKLQYGITLYAGYKGFDLNVLLFGQGGAKFRLDNGFNSSGGGNGLQWVADNTYTLNNTGSELPRIRPTGTAAQDNDFWYQDVSWMRLKSLELGYNLPGSLISKVGIDGLRLYFSGENLFMIFNNLSKYEAGDPQFTGSGKGAQFPNLRSLNFGINLTF
jgi:TonB-linked SusC/RagA family outer membrane protein